MIFDIKGGTRKDGGRKIIILIKVKWGKAVVQNKTNKKSDSK